MKWIPFAVVAVAAFPLAFAAPVPKKKATALYFPTTVGTKWVMECGKERSEYTVTEGVEKEGEWLVKIEVLEGGEKGTAERVVSAEGVFGKLPSGKRTKLLESPPKKGAKWAAEEHFANGQLEVAVVCEVLREEKVKVPAGEFEAVVVEERVEHKGKLQAKSTRWYAPGRGVVKMVVGKDEEWVMTSFEKGK
jgi:hypothetical protein